jgi:hypothetical protein
MALVSEPMTCDDIVGLTPNSFGLPVFTDTLYSKPSPITYDGVWDWNNYGGILAINNLMGQGSVGDDVRENGVIHPRFNGELRDDTSLMECIYQQVPGQNNSWFGYQHEKLTLRPFYTPVNEIIQVGTDSFGYRNFYLWYSQIGPSGDDVMDTNLHDWMVGFCQYLTDVGEVSDIVAPWSFYWRNFDLHVEKHGNHFSYDLSYDYEMRVDLIEGQAWSTFRVNITLGAGFSPVVSIVDPTSWNPIHPDVFGFGCESSVDVIDWYSPLSTTSAPKVTPISVDFPIRTQFYTQPLKNGFAGSESNFTIFRNTYRKWGHDIRDYFSGIMDMNMPHIRTSSFFAASDALDKKRSLKANHLENLSQLSAIAELLPDLEALSSLLAKAAKGDPSAVLEAVDFLTEEILKFRFGTAPNAGDAAELLRHDLLREISSLSKIEHETLYGKFSYTFTSDENFMGDGVLVLDTRSKIRIQIDLSTLMTSILALDSIGLLPTLERVWEILPFSFVVDWFTNMSKRLHSADKQLEFLAIRTDWCLHSYRISWYPSAELLKDFHLENVPSAEPFSISLYQREFTRVMPLLRDSKFDFQRATQGPNALTVGCLLWQAVL